MASFESLELSAFEYARTNTSYRRAFDRGMSSHSVTQSNLVLEALRDYDFSYIRTICDIGGGHGRLISALLNAHPHLSGFVLDLPEVFSDASQLRATKIGVEDRCAHVGGDMFKQVPPADAYSLKMILHDWNDQECIEILANLRGATSCNGRVLIIEHHPARGAAVALDSVNRTLHRCKIACTRLGIFHAVAQCRMRLAKSFRQLLVVSLARIHIDVILIVELGGAGLGPGKLLLHEIRMSLAILEVLGRCMLGSPVITWARQSGSDQSPTRSRIPATRDRTNRRRGGRYSRSSAAKALAS